MAPSAKGDRAPNPTPPIDLNTFLSLASFWRPETIVESAWLQHAPFAFWIVDALRPASFVELGTHRGFSYLCVCQAVRRLGLDTRCFAVDTWAGDEHAGHYSEDVYEALRTSHDARYSDFSRLVRSRFDEALHYFEDNSIDLFHIDGRHFYDDVKVDFEMWRPKLSKQAIVLFHDTNVRERNFGVWKFWAEICRGRPSFEFVHGHGLGVLAYGEKASSRLQTFFALDDAAQAQVRETYFRLGATIESGAQRQEAPTQAPAPQKTAPDPAKRIGELHIHMAAMSPQFMDVRTRLPMQELAKSAGVSVSMSQKRIETPRLPLDQPKILIVQRVFIKEMEGWIGLVDEIVRKGWLLVAEEDDHPELLSQVHGEVREWKTPQSVHAVQTSTAIMAGEIRAHNPEVAFFENAAYRVADRVVQPRADGSLKVFFGALNRERFSSQIGAALSEFAATHSNVQFVVVHDKAFFQGLGVANKVFHAALPYDQYLDLMAGCDIALMPLEGIGGEKYKSDIKFVEAASSGVACIASPTVYGATIAHDADGLIASSAAEWPLALARLYSDPALRLRLAETALAYVRTSRTFSNQADRRVTWYKDIWARRQELNASLQDRIAVYRSAKAAQ